MTFTKGSTVGTKNVNWKGGRPLLKCEICEKNFLGYLHRKARYCSKQCCGKAKLGKPSWIKGKKAVWSTGEKNHKWKGDSAGVGAIHSWIERIKGKPTKCEYCGLETQNRRKIHWANTRGHQYRKNVDDFIALCVSCHRLFDGFSIETRKKMSIAKLGKPTWNKGLVGVMRDNGHRFKKGLPPPTHKLDCKCFRCHKLIASSVSNDSYT